KIPIQKPFDQLPKKSQEALSEGLIKALDHYYETEDVSEEQRDWLMQYQSSTVCPTCNGKRLKPSSLAVKVKGIPIADLTGLPILRALETVRKWKLTGREHQIGGKPVEEITHRLEFLVAVGLEYLSLDRSSATLSGGEAQRIRLATQIGSKLRGVLYV